jgi:hypothetical protein
MSERSTAQQIHEFLGIPTREGHKQAHGSKNASATKSGPGRYHDAGHEKSSPVKSKGASRGFALHTASGERKSRRELVKAHGRRQALKMLKFWRAESKAANDERTDARSSRHYEQPELV